MLNSSALRFTVLVTGAFALAVAALGVVTLMITRVELNKVFDASIRSEAHALNVEYGGEGRDAVIYAVRDRDNTPGHLSYGLDGPGGRALAGRLAGRHGPVGWSQTTIQLADGTRKLIHVYGEDLPDGHRLFIGDEADRNAALENTVTGAFAVAFVGVLLLGGVSGLVLSRGFQRRIADLSGTAEAIIDGDLARRVPLRGSGGDLDRLALTFNRMLDRIGVLMESLRHVSSDVAHDLRTPLHRVRGHLEVGLAERDDAARVEAINRALGEMDGVLDTFTALLRIAEAESGQRLAAFVPADLTQLAAHVVEAFAPSAEEEGRRLTLAAPGPAKVEGDPELLTQMLVNLVENALRHTPPGSSIEVGVLGSAEGMQLIVVDDGPGIPPGERAKVFDRFYRVEASRASPGSGLGLALVAAVARLHGARVTLSDAGPGLKAEVLFPQRP